MAFGPCLLTSRADYERAGGHEAVRGEILDDVAARGRLPPGGPAGAVRRRGRRRSGCAAIPAGCGQLVDGWTKNFASGARRRRAAGAALAAVAWVSAHHAVAVGAALALVEALTGRGASLVAGSPAAVGGGLGRGGACSCAGCCAGPARSAGGRGRCSPCPCWPSTSSSPGRPPSPSCAARCAWRGREVALAGGRSGEEVA